VGPHWYEENFDENNERYLVAMMPELMEDIIKLYEKLIGGLAKEYETPGMLGECTKKNEGDAVQHEMYRKLTGKIMYLVTKLLIEGSNAARELARQFGNLNEHHWLELGRFVGYLKCHKEVKC
jgi:hypothetical protein